MESTHEEKPPQQQPQPQPLLTGLDFDANQEFEVFPGDVVSSEQQTATSQIDNAHSSPVGDATGTEASDRPLDDCLRGELRTDEQTGKEYMSLRVLGEVMTEARVLREFALHNTQPCREDIDNICLGDDTDPTKPRYTKVFAILVLVGKSQDFHLFVRESLSDERLPFMKTTHSREHKERASLYRNDESESTKTPIQACNHWSPRERSMFYTNQLYFMVHFFQPRPDRSQQNLASEEPEWVEKLHKLAVLPMKEWKPQSSQENKSNTYTGNSYAGGSYGAVSRFVIEERDHGFKNLLNKVRGLFSHQEMIGLLEPHSSPAHAGRPSTASVLAVKKLIKHRNETEADMRKRFFNEVNVLWRLDGTVHPHLLTMLTAFVRGSQEFNFVFPLAECNLAMYWACPSTWRWEAESFTWAADQICGVMGAIGRLHEPKHLHEPRLEPEDRFGLHADIKPDNILFFRSSRHPRGILVLSDFGLSEFHRETSRSNIPNQKIPGVPQYRPPECDVEGGQISRKYDIWTLGCLFVDLLTWLLGGQALLDRMEEEVETPYITGGLRKMFYQINELSCQEPDSIRVRSGIIKKTDETKWYGIKINPMVDAWIETLKQREECPDFVREALALIQGHMLKLPVRDRSTARSLGGKFKQLRAAGGQLRPGGPAALTDYFFKGGAAPALHTSLPPDAHLSARKLPVYIVGSMNDEARKVISANQKSLRLPVHDNLKEETIEGLSSLRVEDGDVI